jgi:hypothetical protein
VITVENIPMDVQPGIYEFDTTGAAGTLTATLVSGVDPDSTYYDQDISGSLNITAVANNTLTGTFDFAAREATNGVETADQAALGTVNVVAEFNNLPLP